MGGSFLCPDRRSDESSRLGVYVNVFDSHDIYRHAKPAVNLSRDNTNNNNNTAPPPKKIAPAQRPRFKKCPKDASPR
jgi:hypothetical protein